jgi:hypothetical protein
VKVTPGSEEFDLHVHKCFGRIFEQLLKVDRVVKEAAEKEEAEGKIGVMNDLRDWIEDIMLHCHLAWQYHRLSKGPTRANTWEQVNQPSEDGESGE